MLLLMLLSGVQVARAALAPGCHYPRLDNDFLVADCVDPESGKEFLFVDIDNTLMESYYEDKDDSADAADLMYARWTDTMNDSSLRQAGQPPASDSIAESSPLQRRQPPAPDSIALQTLGGDITEQTRHDPRPAQFDGDVEQGLSPSHNLVDQSSSHLSTSDSGETSVDSPSIFSTVWSKVASNLGRPEICALVVGLTIGVYGLQLPRQERCVYVDQEKFCIYYSQIDPTMHSDAISTEIATACVNECRSKGSACDYTWANFRLLGRPSVKHWCTAPTLPTGDPPQTQADKTQSLDDLD